MNSHPQLFPEPEPEDLEMTVCIAAIASDGSICAVSDKMLSDDDTTYEPQVSKKVFKLTDLCFAMNAGHDGTQAEIMTTMQGIINAAMAEKKDQWQFSVKAMIATNRLPYAGSSGASFSETRILE
jgi:hypothetical protein